MCTCVCVYDTTDYLMMLVLVCLPAALARGGYGGMHVHTAAERGMDAVRATRSKKEETRYENERYIYIYIEVYTYIYTLTYCTYVRNSIRTDPPAVETPPCHGNRKQQPNNQTTK